MIFMNQMGREVFRPASSSLGNGIQATQMQAARLCPDSDSSFVIRRVRAISGPRMSVSPSPSPGMNEIGG
ncbi:hypothetical protein BDW74DRAFT_160947 [Aspergillus multicolor]|uniref:uncharacterized protein n=1 Tax=Aspergillus multicolor TaxID=41759 RepID=UPI003CCDB9B4